MSRPVIATGTAIFLMLTVFSLSYPVTLSTTKVFNNYNEGWNAYHAQAVIDGEDLYPGRDALVVNNYPPLYFMLLAGSSIVSNDLVLSGRLLSLSAFLACALLISLIIFSLYRSLLLALFTSCFFICYFILHDINYISINDPQWTGHFVQLLALFLIMRRPESRTTLAVSSFLLVFSGFIKHILVPLPLAVFLYLVASKNRYWKEWLIISILCLGIAFALCFFVYGSDFFTSLFGNPRNYSLKHAYWKFLYWSDLIVPLMLFVPVFLFVCKYSRSDKLLLLYLACSFVIGGLFIGGKGVVHNALFDLLIALILVACSTLFYIGNMSLKFRFKNLVIGLLIIYILYPVVSLTYNHRVIKKLSLLHVLPVYEEITADTVAIVEKYEDPVACENLALCYWAGKEFFLDYFNIGERIRLDDRGQRDLLISMISNKELKLIHIEPDSTEKRLPDIIVSSIEDNYYLIDKNIYGHIYAPTP